MLKRAFLKTLQAVKHSSKQKGASIIALMCLQSVLDFFSIAAFIPVIGLIINPGSIETNASIKSLYDTTDLKNHASFVILVTSCIFAFTLLKNLFSVWVSRVKAAFAFNVANELSSTALTHYLHKGYSFFTDADYAQELNKITGNPIIFANHIVLPLTTICSEILVSLFLISSIIYFDFKVVIVVGVLLIPLTIILALRRKALIEISNTLKKRYPTLIKYAQQIIEAQPEIKMYGRENYFHNKFFKINTELNQAFVKEQTLQSASSRWIEGIAAFIICSLIVYAAVTYEDYQKTLFMLSLYAGASFRIIPSLTRILGSLQQIRTHEYLISDVGIRPVKEFNDEVQSDDLKFEEALTMTNVTYSYPAGPTVLRDISLKIRKGEKVVVTGNSGEGKTTLLMLILKFIEPDNGEVLIDGKVIKDQNAWLKKFSFVPQQPYILDGSIMENIAFGVSSEKIDREKVMMLVQELELNEVVNQSPNGINSRIGEKGVKISGGQRQRIAIARALYADSDIILLDEATNQVHDAAEIEIMVLLGKLASKKKTVIMITHKILNRDFFDSIYFLENGLLRQL